MHNNARNGSGPEAQAPTTLIVTPTVEVGGSGRMVVDMAAAAVKAGGRAIVMSSGGRLLPELLRSGATHVAANVLSASRWSLLRLGWQIGRLVRKEGVHLIHAMSTAAAWAATVSQRFHQVPLVVTLAQPFTPTTRLEQGFKSAISRADRIIAVSNFAAACLGDEEITQNASIIPYGINLARFNPGAVKADRLIKLSQKWLLPDGVPLILMTGAALPGKGHELMVEALAALGDRPFHCLILGDDLGYEDHRQQIEDLIIAKGLEGKVRFGGFCEDMPAAYMLADLVVVPNTVPEAYSCTAAEAQAMGRPVTAANHGATADVVKSWGPTALFTPNDPDALAKSILAGLALTAEKREAIALMARAHVEHAFALEAVTLRILEVYDSALVEAAQLRLEARRSA